MISIGDESHFCSLEHYHGWKIGQLFQELWGQMPIYNETASVVAFKKRLLDILLADDDICQLEVEKAD